jgi:hypothetical protein
MLSYIAYLAAQESTERQFHSAPSSIGHPLATSLSRRFGFRFSARIWAQPLAAALHGAAVRLEALAQPDGEPCAQEWHGFRTAR